MPPTQIVAPNCTPSNVDYNCCTSANPCANGEGDCDDDSDCISGHCAHDVGGNYGAPTIFDVCEAPQAPNCPPSLVDYNCCTSSNPCANGDGDCDSDKECISGYCDHNVGASYGVSSTFDVCNVDPRTPAPTTPAPSCAPANVDFYCCTSSSPCQNGDGDCDYDNECISGHCEHNVGARYGITTSFDVCAVKPNTAAPTVSPTKPPTQTSAPTVSPTKPPQIVAPNCTPSNVDYNCCTSTNPCANGEGDCDSDNECISGHCAHDVGGNYGAPTIFDVCEAPPAPNCPPSLVDYNCCTSSNPCANGDGDCDSDKECISGYCDHNVGASYGVSSTFDVCNVDPRTPAPTTPAPSCAPANVDFYCCTSSNPCQNGDGDCDYDNECISGHCEHNVGARYGITTSFDVCATKPLNTAAPTVSPTMPPTQISVAPNCTPSNVDYN